MRQRISRGWTLFSVLLTVAALEGLGRLWMMNDLLRPVPDARQPVRIALFRPPPRPKLPVPPRPKKRPGIKAKKPLPIASIPQKKAVQAARPSVSHRPSHARAGAGAPLVLAAAPSAVAAPVVPRAAPPRLLTQKNSPVLIPLAVSGGSGTPTLSFGGSGGTGGGAGSGNAGSGSGGGAGGEPFGLGTGGGGGGGPRHVVYVLDISLSMQSRISRARQELLAGLDGLGPDDSFDIIVFGGTVQVFDRALVPATPSDRAQAHFFLSTLLLIEGTNLEAALSAALAVPGANQVFVITDGVPTEGETDWDRLSRRVRTLNSAHAEIDAIGLVGRDPDGIDKTFEGARLLQKLTGDSGGHYRQVTLGIDE